MFSSIILPCTRTSLTFGSFEVCSSGISGKCQTTQSHWDKCTNDRFWVENKQNLIVRLGANYKYSPILRWRIVLVWFYIYDQIHICTKPVKSQQQQKLFYFINLHMHFLLWIMQDILSLSSQSEHEKNLIHWFGKYSGTSREWPPLMSDLGAWSLMGGGCLWEESLIAIWLMQELIGISVRWSRKRGCHLREVVT